MNTSIIVINVNVRGATSQEVRSCSISRVVRANEARVKRSELFNDENVDDQFSMRDSLDPTTVADEATHLATQPLGYEFEYDFVEQQQITPRTEESPPQAGVSQGDEAFEFRLFGTTKASKPAEVTPEESASKNTSSAVALISIRSPTPDAQRSDGRFVRPSRPQSFYFTAALSEDEAASLNRQFISAAIAGHDVVSRSVSTGWPGTHLPWRVLHIPRASSKVSPDDSQDTGKVAAKTKKCKMSKRRRIMLRQKSAAVEAAKIREQEKEVEMRAKKSAKNRKQQLRRREKERQKKQEVGGGNEDDDSEVKERKEETDSD